MKLVNEHGLLGVHCEHGEEVDLGKKCVVCGTASGLETTTATISHWPKPIALLIPAGLVPFLIALALTVRSCQLTYATCPEHKKQLRARMTAWACALLVGALLLAIFALAEQFGLLLLAILALLPVFALYWRVQPITISRYEKGLFVLREVNATHFVCEENVNGAPSPE